MDAQEQGASKSPCRDKQGATPDRKFSECDVHIIVRGIARIFLEDGLYMEVLLHQKRIADNSCTLVLALRSRTVEADC